MNTNLFGTVLRGRNIALVTLALSAMVTSAYADPVTIINGNFSSVTGNTTTQSCGFHCTESTSSNELTTANLPGQNNTSYTGASVAGWTNATGYNFIFVPGSNSASSSYGFENVTMWNDPTPSGTNVIALDSDFPSPTTTGGISQAVTVTHGDSVTITFGLALDAQNIHPNATAQNPFSETLTVSLGGQSQTLDLTYNGTTAWTTQNVTFNGVAGGSELLSFVAANGPDGGPSFVLLDNVSASQSPVPEPGSLALLSTGLIGLGGLVRSRFKK